MKWNKKIPIIFIGIGFVIFGISKFMDASIWWFTIYMLVGIFTYLVLLAIFKNKK